MFAFDSFFQRHLTSIKSEGRYRVFTPLERLANEPPYALWHGPHGAQKVVIWCTNDYLGMSHHPKVLEAFTSTALNHGVGSGGTRNIAGTSPLHEELEREVASLHGKESALVLSSGYTANEAAFSTLGSAIPNVLFFSDEKNHASMIQGMRHSVAERYIFRHNSVDHLRLLLQDADPSRPKIISCVSLYSMDGDVAPLKDICDVADEYGALVYVDEVHAVGLYGERGGGILQQENLESRVAIIQGNFAKAYGVVGGYLAGSSAIIDFIRSNSPDFIFTTSLPPAVAQAALTSIRILKEDRSRALEVQALARHLQKRLREENIPFQKTNTHMTPVLVNDPFHCQALSKALLEEEGIYSQPINYPTVPRGYERLRITVTPFHTTEMIEALVQGLKRQWFASTPESLRA